MEPHHAQVVACMPSEPSICWKNIPLWPGVGQYPYSVAFAGQRPRPGNNLAEADTRQSYVNVRSLPHPRPVPSTAEPGQ